jgi:hypothetical protein
MAGRGGVEGAKVQVGAAPRCVLVTIRAFALALALALAIKLQRCQRLGNGVHRLARPKALGNRPMMITEESAKHRSVVDGLEPQDLDLGS